MRLALLALASVFAGPVAAQPVCPGLEGAAALACVRAGYRPAVVLEEAPSKDRLYDAVDVAERAGVPPEPGYPGHFEARYISPDGAIRPQKRQVSVSQALGGEHVGLEEVGDGVWSVCFYDRLLARLDERTWKLSA